MKIYLDMCCLKRPFDNQSDARVQVETLALESILQLCRTGQHDLMESDALRFENSRNPNFDRQQFVEMLLKLASDDVANSTAIELRANVWQNAGVTLLDSLHLASAELGGAEAFSTCDDELLVRCRRVPSTLRVVSLIELFKELVPWASS